MTASKPSQWALLDGYVPQKLSDCWSFEDAKNYFQQNEGFNPIHVIEYSAYEKMKTAYESLSREFKIYKNAANKEIEKKDAALKIAIEALKASELEMLTIDDHINYGKMSRYSSKHLCKCIRSVQQALEQINEGMK